MTMTEYNEILSRAEENPTLPSWGDRCMTCNGYFTPDRSGGCLNENLEVPREHLYCSNCLNQ